LPNKILRIKISQKRTYAYVKTFLEYIKEYLFTLRVCLINLRNKKGEPLGELFFK